MKKYKYKAPFDMYDRKVKKGDLFSQTSNPNFYTSNNAADKWLPKEIVEKWEVFYEEEKLEAILKGDNLALIELPSPPKTETK